MAEVVIKETIAWDGAVDAAMVLDEMRAVFARFIEAEPHYHTALALWCAMTHAEDAFNRLPQLIITGPDGQCGKTTSLDIVAEFSNKAVSVSSITKAALYRLVDLHHVDKDGAKANAQTHTSD